MWGPGGFVGTGRFCRDRAFSRGRAVSRGPGGFVGPDRFVRAESFAARDGEPFPADRPPAALLPFSIWCGDPVPGAVILRLLPPFCRRRAGRQRLKARLSSSICSGVVPVGSNPMDLAVR